MEKNTSGGARPTRDPSPFINNIISSRGGGPDYAKEVFRRHRHFWFRNKRATRSFYLTILFDRYTAIVDQIDRIHVLMFSRKVRYTSVYVFKNV